MIRRRLRRRVISLPYESEGQPVGDLAGPTAVVDQRGCIVPIDSSWVIDWAVGAEDRWHVARDEAAVRQQLIRDMPVVATFMRIPGGDVVHRVAGISDGTHRGLLIEIENQSPAAVSVAFSVMPRPAGDVRCVGVRGRSVEVNGRPALRLPTSPGSVIVVDGLDPFARVGETPRPGDADLKSAAGRAAAAVVLPLPHRTTVTAVVPIDGSPVGSSAEAVANGWEAVIGRAAVIELPDESVNSAWRAAIGRALLDVGSADPRTAACAAGDLDRVGLFDEADRGRETLVAALEAQGVPGPAAVAGLRALASRKLVAARPSGLDSLAGPLAEQAGTQLDSTTVRLVAAALDQEGSPAVVDALGLAEALQTVDVDHSSEIERLAEVVAIESGAELNLIAEPQERWRGNPVDVRKIRTRHGSVSFSVRWHGERPALLWELEGFDNPVTIRCGLDPPWSTTERAGEALLS